MFNPLRLFRRKDHIDDTATAYIEGRATDAEMAELKERAAREPGLMAELDSLRQTVSLLKSVEPARAPRSFALSHAPVRARTRRPKIALAPAVLAIIAAAGVGLLAVGNLADVVRQSGDSPTISFSGSGGSSEDSVAMTESVTGPPGEPGRPGRPAVTQDPAGATVEQEFDQDSSIAAMTGATPTVVASLPLATPAALPTTGPEDGRADPVAPPVEPDLGADRENGQGEDGSAFFGGTTATPEEAGTSSAERNSGVEGITTGEGLVVEPEDNALALPQATAAVPPGGFGFTAEQAGQTAESANEPKGVALPLWQLQLSFASLAVLMAGAWFLLQRRLTA